MANLKNTTIQTGFRTARGTTGQRPTNPEPGMLRYNTSTSKIEYFNGSEWIDNDQRKV